MATSKTKTLSTEAPKAVVTRLSLYLRELQHIHHQGDETVSSTQLGGRLGFSDAQVRKDFAYFGQFGRPGIGYRCEELIAAIRTIMGADLNWPIALVGAGNLGRALLRYKGFSERRFQIVSAFDTDPEKVGSQIEGVSVHPLDAIETVAAKEKFRLGIIATPAESAQHAADRLVAAGVSGVLNFAPVAINLPENICTAEVDLAIELEQLSFAVVNQLSEK